MIVHTFTNEVGEVWRLERAPGALTAFLSGDEAGDERHEVRYYTTKERSEDLAMAVAARQVGLNVNVDPHVRGLILDTAESAWLAQAWWATCSREERQQQIQHIAEEIAAWFASPEAASLGSKGEAVAIATVATKAATLRGMDPLDEQTLIAEVLRLRVANKG